METIIVKSLKRVGVNNCMLVVGINGNREATMNAKWQEQEIDFIEKDVGLGGNFLGELQQKGQYLNITKVDMSSAKKGEVQPTMKVEDGPFKTYEEVKPEVFLKDDRILAAVLLKGAVEMAKGHNFDNLLDEEKYMCEAVGTLNQVYKVALDMQK